MTSFVITHLSGSMESVESVAGLEALLDELASATAEHGDVAVGHESGWTLTVLPSGRVVWENVEENDVPRHLDQLSREGILELMGLVAAGDLTTVEARQWVSGYGTAPGAEPRR